ncbi:MAG: DUF934 domain-containing protein [Paracoccaceae bacterium]
MSVTVTDDGFATVERGGDFDDANALDLAPDTEVEALRGKLKNIRLIRVDFPNFADGRGFTIARRLRSMGYRGRLRARGYVIADQYTMARRAGFDEVEISDALAARQGEDQWLARADWREHDYQSRLRASL